MKTIENLPNPLSSNIKVRFLRDDEKSIMSDEKELPLVIEPVKERSFPVLSKLVRENSDWFNQQRDTYGAILFRGFEVESGVQFQSILELLKVELEKYYHFGSAQRLRITDKVFTSSEAPPNLIVMPHNELNMVPIRPSVLAFFCQTKPDLYGETPILNTEKVFNDLFPSFQYKIANLAQKYVRFVPKSLLGMVFEKQSREEITKLLQNGGFYFDWKDDGSLYFECSYIPVFSHPRTGRLCFGISICDCLVSREWYRSILPRYRLMKRIYYNFMPYKLYQMLEQIRTEKATVVDDSTSQYSKLNTFFVGEEGNCLKLTEAEAKELGKAEWRNAAVFPWEKGDLLVIDNLQVAHSRLNTRLPRKILTAFGNMCDIRSMNPACCQVTNMELS
ncbi:TauD/TfdA family dioxygenase [Roseofilum sp. BLCC_M154]|uniref:TauD/TfdA family dioxygenase n=1 Tax=Roseofilum acuticapitatum BLCC-M154 TaxID=3022444 RepID=A0ABT7AXW0_9CYAN|nr:TauD/TfdA family dioxygenase [Roseofilum acuticapitatum]MDJ1171750.1 TauD/TfdA family dioxygenase [Roseofilum acuticapitatum BLCC-M154]